MKLAGAAAILPKMTIGCQAPSREDWVTTESVVEDEPKAIVVGMGKLIISGFITGVIAISTKGCCQSVEYYWVGSVPGS